MPIESRRVRLIPLADVLLGLAVLLLPNPDHGARNADFKPSSRHAPQPQGGHGMEHLRGLLQEDSD
jgi:hypothetical protein